MEIRLAVPYGICMMNDISRRPEPETTPTQAAFLIAVLWVVPLVVFVALATAMVCL